MATNNFSNSSSNFQARQQNAQYSPYVSPSVRQQGQRFNYHAPSPYPRPRSSASKPNPSMSNDSINYPVNSCSPADDYYYRSDQSYNNNNNNSINNYGTNANDKNGRFNNSYNSIEYGSPSSEYFSCNEDSFSTPMSSISSHGNYQSPSFSGTQNQYSPYFDAGFASSPKKQPGNYQGSAGYSGTPGQLPQQKRRGFGQRRFTQGRNGAPSPQKRGAASGSSYQATGAGVNEESVQNSPAKKPKVSVRCEICNIDFTSEIPYKMHIVGAKHTKKIKSKEVLEAMESQGQIPQSKDNYFYCEHCQVMTNSSQQLQMHLDGTKHKNKLRKMVEDGMGKLEPMPKEDEADDVGPKPAKIAKFYCDACSLSLNSEIQLTQHLTSKRHEARVKGEPLPVKKKTRKFTDEPTNGDETGDKTTAPTETTNDTAKSENASTQKTHGVQELGSTFVSGGVLQ